MDSGELCWRHLYRHGKPLPLTAHSPPSPPTPQFTQSHKSMYGIYCSNYDTAEALVSKLKTKRKDFEQQLQVPSTPSHTPTPHPHTRTPSHTPTTLTHAHHTHSHAHSTPSQICLANSRVLPGLTFPAYLITPVQRITRYILLLKVTKKIKGLVKIPHSVLVS